MDNLDYIDNYFKGHLNDQEIRQFELRIEQDPVFAQDVAFYVSATGMLKEQADTTTRERFRELEKMQPVRMNPAPVRRLVYYIAAAAVVVGVIAGIYFLQPASAVQLADNYIQDEMVLERNETMGTSVDSMRLATDYYNERNYTAALPIFESFSQEHPDHDEARLNAGITALKAGNYQKAINHFSIHEKLDLYSNPAKFYHAVALMKRNLPGDKELAKKLLQEVVRLNLDKKAKAEQWLKKM
jgi:tetratricopeptide (TPR) repeat protein